MKNIVLIHGWGASAGKLQPLSDELNKLGWNTFVPKLPGFDIAAPNSVWGVEEYAEYVLGKANTYFKGKKYYLFGHSFGGRIAIYLSAKFSRKVEGLVLCATSGISRDSIFKRIPLLIISKSVKIVKTIPLVGKVVEKMYYFGQNRYYSKTPGIMKQIFQKVVDHSSKPYLKLIKVPTLILWGDEDKLTPVKDAKYIKSKINSPSGESKLKIYEGVGHKLPYEKPVELAKEIEKWI